MDFSIILFFQIFPTTPSLKNLGGTLPALAGRT